MCGRLTQRVKNSDWRGVRHLAPTRGAFHPGSMVEATAGAIRPRRLSRTPRATAERYCRTGDGSAPALSVLCAIHEHSVCLECGADLTWWAATARELSRWISTRCLARETMITISANVATGHSDRRSQATHAAELLKAIHRWDGHTILCTKLPRWRETALCTDVISGPNLVSFVGVKDCYFTINRMRKTKRTSACGGWGPSTVQFPR